ncbi:RDD family protein [Salinimonas lutimaris]|uniref:RDD family protein n=1 Tax=Salinimonas lutimaris TaxID=914153 RepID=UPI0010C1314D|nr:RDD family protein [Salinimonas lutimaris]
MTDFEAAGFWRRFCAVMLDVLLFFVFITIPVSLTLGSVMLSTGSEPLNWVNVTFGYVLPFLLTLWFWQKFLGTPGKMLMGIQIVDFNTGRRASVIKSTVRYVAYLVSMIPLGLGFLWVAFDKNKRGFHDHLSGTAVIVKQPEFREMK